LRGGCRHQRGGVLLTCGRKGHPCGPVRTRAPVQRARLLVALLALRACALLRRTLSDTRVHPDVASAPAGASACKDSGLSACGAQSDSLRQYTLLSSMRCIFTWSMRLTEVLRGGALHRRCMGLLKLWRGSWHAQQRSESLYAGAIAPRATSPSPSSLFSSSLSLPSVSSSLYDALAILREAAEPLGKGRVKGREPETGWGRGRKTGRKTGPKLPVTAHASRVWRGWGWQAGVARVGGHQIVSHAQTHANFYCSLPCENLFSYCFLWWV
jgi:hypothetical protein